MQAAPVQVSNAIRVPVIIWGNRKLIHQRQKAVSQACAHPRLRGRKLLARGAYALVFDAGESVLKLTVDGLAYRLAAQQAHWQSPGLPGTIALHGEVGVTAFGVPLYLFEQERLMSLEPGSDARKQSLQIGRMVRENAARCFTAADQLNDILPRVVDARLADAVRHLATFAAEVTDTAGLDLHASNFMQRDQTAATVITDPFLDRAVLHLAQQHSLRETGLPSNTVFI